MLEDVAAKFHIKTQVGGFIDAKFCEYVIDQAYALYLPYHGHLSSNFLFYQHKFLNNLVVNQLNDCKNG